MVAKRVSIGRGRSRETQDRNQETGARSQNEKAVGKDLSYRALDITQPFFEEWLNDFIFVKDLGYTDTSTVMFQVEEVGELSKGYSKSILNSGS